MREMIGASPLLWDGFDRTISVKRPTLTDLETAMDCLTVAVCAAELADTHELFINPHSSWNVLNVIWETYYHSNGTTTSYVEVATRPIVGVL
jgi:hypothetical protein